MVLLALFIGAAKADVRLPAFFSDHMVLQAGLPVNVWGWANAGEEVKVLFAGQAVVSKAGPDGKWLVKLAALKPASQPQTMLVQGKNTIAIKDVLVGEVWLASGQSNMEMKMKDPQHGSVDRVEEELAAARYPEIRAFIPATTYSIYELAAPPQESMSDLPGAWRVCSPETAAEFSAMGYFFARDLHRTLHMPVGILTAAVGGTPIEAWTSRTAQALVPELNPLLEDWQKRLAGFDPEREQKDFLEKKNAWLKERAAATKAGKAAPKAPSAFKNLQVSAPGGLFNALIAPLAPFSLRGVIWYQGERNAAGPFTGLYGVQLRTLIADWRARWGTEFYFAWVQLPRFQKEQRLPSEPNGWGVAVREGMLKALAIPQTGMAVTIDLGGPTGGHPTNKGDFAARLSPVVLHDVYRQPLEIWCGPLFRSAVREGSKLVVSFEHAQGLKSAKGELKGFAIAGGDQKFVWAKAEIIAGKVVVWSDSVPEPVAVRYAWAGNPECNLVNGAGLPASPFRTDTWADALDQTPKDTAPPPAPASESPKPAPVPKEKATKTKTPAYTTQIAVKLKPTRQVVYKKIAGRELRLDLFEPPNWKPTDRRACFVSIHGGGWTSGSPVSMYPFTAHCAEKGMVGISVQYRLYAPGTEVSVFECVKDARSAMRYVRAHAAELGIDPQQIVVNGASAGGHLAASTALFDINEAGEDATVSCAPNALVLFSAVIDTSKEGYGNAKIGERWQELSPAHQVRKGVPPTIVFHGTGDATTPFAGAELFYNAMVQAGNRCELVAVPGEQHTYMFKDPARYTQTLALLDAFLASLGLLK